MDKLKAKYYYFSAVTFIVTAIFSAGFWHPDEHFQILELINLKDSNAAVIDKSIFNWDFNDQIRSWFQPFIYFYILKPLSFLSPFSKALFLRLLNGMLLWFALRKLYKHFFVNWEKNLFLTSLVWFIPFIAVRTSSESLSTSLFILGYVFLLKEKNPFLIALLMGMSFLSRYQMGIPIFFLGTYSYLKEREYKSFSMFSFGIVFTVALGVLIDYWGYGSWNFSAYNYFYTNLVESRASSFGVEPFWYYFYKPVLKGVPPLSVVFIISYLIYIYKKKVNILNLSTISFLLVHSFVPHKEVRFLSLIYILTPFMYFRAQELIKSGILEKIFKLSLVLNILVLIKVMFVPIQGEMALYKEVYSRNISKLYVESEKDQFIFNMPFYMKNTVNTYVDKNKKGTHLSTKLSTYKYYSGKCENIYLSYPKFIFKYNYFNWLDRSSIIALWDCK